MITFATVVVIIITVVLIYPQIFSKMIDLMSTCISRSQIIDEKHFTTSTSNSTSFSIHGDLDAKITNTKIQARKNLSMKEKNKSYLKETDTASTTDESNGLMKQTKTIYLIRHAESNENHRLECLSRALKRVGKLSLPSKEDVATSIELLDVKGQVDSDVSGKGREQIQQLAARLEKDDFIREKRIQLVAHSNLKRARQTSEGMLGCLAMQQSTESDSNDTVKKPDYVNRVVELPCLAERTPMEWLPINHDAFSRRIAEFEMWLEEQPEERIAIVGHSNYFRAMLGLKWKFNNCDVWEVMYQCLPRETDECSNRIDVFDNTVQVFEKTHPNGFETIKSKDSQDEVVPNDSSEEHTDQNIEKYNLPRGWSDLKILYRFKDA